MVSAGQRRPALFAGVIRLEQPRRLTAFKAAAAPGTGRDGRHLWLHHIVVSAAGQKRVALKPIRFVAAELAIVKNVGVPHLEGIVRRVVAGDNQIVSLDVK